MRQRNIRVNDLLTKAWPEVGSAPAICVSGASGALGRLLMPAWALDGGQVRALPGRDAGLDMLMNPGRLRAALRGQRVLIHLAGPVPRGGAIAPHVHRDLALAALAAARDAGVAQVFILSSAAVYGARRGPCVETDVLRPVSEYGRAKQRMEWAVGSWCAANRDAPRVTVLRLGNVVGADQLLMQAGALVALDHFADGQGPRRSYIGPRQLARVLSQLATLGASGVSLPRVLNIAAMTPVGMQDLLRAAGRGWCFRPAPPRAIAEVRLCTARLRALVGTGLLQASAGDMVAQWQALRAEHQHDAC